MMGLCSRCHVDHHVGAVHGLNVGTSENSSQQTSQASPCTSLHGSCKSAFLLYYKTYSNFSINYPIMINFLQNKTYTCNYKMLYNILKTYFKYYLVLVVHETHHTIQGVLSLEQVQCLQDSTS